MNSKKDRKKKEIPWPQLFFRWENFRSFKDTGWFELRPITIILGPNNSGKTNLIRPLLLLKQTVDSADENIPLKITGPLADVGTYRNLVHLGRTNNPIRISIRFHTREKPRPEQKLKPIGDYPPGEVKLEFRMGTDPVNVNLTRFEVLDICGRSCVVRRKLQSAGYSLRTRLNLKSNLLRLFRSVGPDHFMFSGSDVFQRVIGEEIQAANKKRRRPQIRKVARLVLSGAASELMAFLDSTEGHIKTILSRFSYVGPLRDYPKRFYESTEETPETVGVRGEHAPHILYLAKDETLKTKTNRWLKLFGLARKIGGKSFHDDLFSLNITDQNKSAPVDYSDSGFGLSQLLPLIVEGFYADPRAVLFLEQPEIHLNPKLQCQLANLFAAFAEEKKAVIIETHSEHLVLRIRTLVAEKKLKPEDVALYYVEKDKHVSSLERILISQDGHINPDAWPAGFFEDSLGEALKLAKAVSS